MSATREIKTILALDGEKKYKDAIKSIKQQQQELNTQLKASSAAFDLANDKSGKLRAQSQTLTKQIELQKRQVEEAKNAVDQATKKYGANAEATKELQIQLYNAEGALSRYQRKLIETNRDLELHESHLRKTGDTMQNVGKKMDAFGDKMSSAGSKLTTNVTVPLVAAAGAAVAASISFEESLAKVSTMLDLTQVDMETYKQGIVDLSNKTGESVEEISEGVYQALSAGVDPTKVLSFMEVANKAAIAGFTDNATAVDGITTALNSYGESADEADRIANEMLITQNLGKTTFGELAKSIGQVTPLASQLGLETGELFSSLASTTAQGIATSQSVSGLKAAMANIIKPTAEAEKAAAALGLDFSAGAVATKGWMPFLKDLRAKVSDAAPEFAKLSDQMDSNTRRMTELEKAGKKGSEEYKALAVETKKLSGDLEVMATAADSPLSAFSLLFGSVEGLNTVLALTSESGAALYTQSMDEMSTNTNALNDTFDKVNNTTGRELKRTFNEAKNALIEFGDIIAPVVKSAADGIKSLTQWLGKMDEKQRKQILTAAAVVAGLGPVLKIIGTLSSTLGTGTKAIGTFISKLAAKKAAASAAAAATSGLASASGAGGLLGALGPVGLAILAVAAAAGGMAIAYNEATRAGKEAGEAGATFAEGIANWHDGVDTAKSSLEGLNEELLMSPERMTAIDSGISEAQGRIIELAQTAAAETREYTDAERAEIESLIDLIQAYTDEKLGLVSEKQDVLKTKVMFDTSVSEEDAYSYIKDAEDLSAEYTAIVEQQYNNAIALANRAYKERGEVDAEQRDNEIREARRVRDEALQIEQDKQAELLKLISSGYGNANKEGRTALENVARIGEELREMDAHNLEVFTSTGEIEKGAVKRRKEKLKELEGAYTDLEGTGADSWIGMLIATQETGGEIDAETQLLIDGLLASYEVLPEKFKSAGKDAIQGLIDGMREKQPDLDTTAASTAGSVNARFRRTMEIASPSKVTTRIGQQVVAGLEVGMQQGETGLIKSTGRIAENVLGEAGRIAELQATLGQQISGLGSLGALTKQPASSGGGTQQMQHVHSGMLEVRGVSSKGEFVDATKIIMQQLELERLATGT